jgi:hypothetical protein
MTQTKFPPIGMSPAVWGPIFWTTMHIVSLGYSATPTSQEQEAAIQFYQSLAYTIPCPICRTHYRAILEEMPVQNAVKSRDDLITWVFNLHNSVNKKLEKPEISFDQYIKNMTLLAAQEYTKIPATPSTLSSATMVLAGAVLGVGGYYLYNKFVATARK